MDRPYGRPRVVGDAAGDDRHMDALGVEPRDQIANVDGDVHHQQISTAAGAQHGERLLIGVGVGDGGTFVHRELCRARELALQRADDQETHGFAPYSNSNWRACCISSAPL
jgi:hypothetical protein